MVDNVLAGGLVVGDDEEFDQYSRESVDAIRRTNELIAADERVDSVMVGVADGLMLARKR